MSVLSIATAKNVATRTGATDNSLLKALGTLTRWLPTEVITGYAATIVLMQPDPETGRHAEISWTPWPIALIATPVLVASASFASHKTKDVWKKTALSVPAFVLWSASVPLSAWNRIDAFDVQNPVVLFALLVVVVVFSNVAEAVAKPDA